MWFDECDLFPNLFVMLYTPLTSYKSRLSKGIDLTF